MGSTVIGRLLRGLTGPRVAVTISYPDADEAEYDPAPEIPTSEPATPQVSFVVASNHMPVWSPCELPHTKTAPLFIVCQDPGGNNRIVYYRLLKNGQPVATGSLPTGSAAFKATAQFRAFLDITQGDVLECSLWANGTGCLLLYKALIVHPTRICAGAGLLADVQVTVSADAGKQLKLGSPTTETPGDARGCLWSNEYRADTPALNASLPQLTWGTYRPHPTYGFGRVYGGDYNSSYQGLLASTYPRYTPDVVFTAISFRPLNLRL